MKTIRILFPLFILFATFIACDNKDEDDTAPVIQLEGYNPFYVSLDGTYTEPGFSASDDTDGDITDKVVVSGDVDTSKEGTYYKFYNVEDEAGNKAQQQVREVQVVLF